MADVIINMLFCLGLLVMSGYMPGKNIITIINMMMMLMMLLMILLLLLLMMMMMMLLLLLLMMIHLYTLPSTA